MEDAGTGSMDSGQITQGYNGNGEEANVYSKDNRKLRG